MPKNAQKKNKLQNMRTMEYSTENEQWNEQKFAQQWKWTKITFTI